MKRIHTLIPDIYEQLQKRDGWFTDEVRQEFANEITLRLSGQLGQPRKEGKLTLSRMGPKCPCQLWHMVHKPELAEKLPPWAEFKYTYGHVIEAIAIGLARAAGHNVTGEQDELVVDGILGHRDCVIDGCIVDVKSSSSQSFSKFTSGSYEQNDSFGYLDQLDGYLVGSLLDPLVEVKDTAYLLAIDKQLGHMVLYTHHIRERHIRERIAKYKRIVELSKPPACTCPETKDGQSGNMKLAFPATYNPFKYCCKPHIRTFVYSDGIRYLTKVVREPQPHVRELNHEGKVIARH